MEFFHVDLTDYWRGRLSLRKIGVYIKSLMRKPGKSTLLMAVDERADWSPDLYVMARISDALELSNYLFIKANSDSNTDIPLPEPITRPAEAEEEKEEKPKPEDFASGHEVAAFFTRMSNL